MSDIFISYASQDRERAQRLAQFLEQQNWAVWWDRKIPPGRSFDEVIGNALQEAKCVIVLWSESSVQSDWVKEEAAVGLRRGILVPAVIDQVAPPLGFSRIQAARLAGWTGDVDDLEFKSLIGSVRTTIGSHPDASRAPGAPIPIVRTNPRKQSEGDSQTPSRRHTRFWQVVLSFIAFAVVGASAVTIWAFQDNDALAAQMAGGVAAGLMAAIPVWVLYGRWRK